MKRIKITSDGLTTGTTVTDAETGEAFGDLVAVTWTAALDEAGNPTFCTAVLTFEGVEVDVVGALAEPPAA